MRGKKGEKKKEGKGERENIPTYITYRVVELLLKRR